MTPLDLSTPCDPWQGYIAPDGYGQTTRGGKRVAPHREAFEQAYGPIPPGMQVGHACHDAALTCPGGDTCPHRACRNVLHLRLQTNAENQWTGVWGRRTECQNGHPYDQSNTYLRPVSQRGQRGCRACNRASAQRYRERKAAERAA